MHLRSWPLLTFSTVVLLVMSGCPFQKKPTSADLSRHKVRQLAYWKLPMAKPFADRIATAPTDLIEYLNLDNEVNGFDGSPSASPLSHEFKGYVQSVLEALPPKFKAKLEDKLIGVFTVTGLGSSAYTDFVRDADGHPVAAFVALDTLALKRKANAWLTWKESSPFLPDSAWRVEGILAEPALDSEREALEFVLIHELAHVVAFDEDVHPLWSLAPKLVNPDDYPFLSVAWTVEDSRYVRKVDKTFPAPGPIIYYKPSSERPLASALPRYYTWLQNSDFVTLYAATNPFDDFADTVATYIHTVVMKKPFEIRIFENGTLRYTIPACWTEPRCAKKRLALEEFLL